MRRAPVLALLAGSLAVGCGGGGALAGGTGATTTAAPGGTLPAGPGPTATAPEAGAPPTDAPPDRTSPSVPGPETARAPVDLVVSAGRLVPAQVAVPGRVPLDLTARSGDRSKHVLRLLTRRVVRVDVPASGRAARQIPPPPHGTYAITVDGRRAGRLVAGAEPGP